MTSQAPLDSYKCNLCGFDHSFLLLGEVKRKTSPQQLNYSYCRRCSFVSQSVEYQEVMPWYETANTDQSNEHLRRYTLQEMAETWSVINLLIALKKSYPEILDMIFDGQNKIMADVGCGAGGSLIAYKTFGWDAVGIEPGERMSNFARDANDLIVKGDSIIANYEDKVSD